MRPGKIEKFASLSPFASLTEFNQHMKRHLAQHKDNFTKSEYIAFQRLFRYSAKYHGVANAKIATLVSACNEDARISRSSFERMLRKARKLGIVKIHHTVREKGGYAHNVFVFQRFDGAEPEKLTERETPKTLTPTGNRDSFSDGETGLKRETDDKDKKRIEDDLDYTYTSDSVPKAFRDLVKCIYDSAETIERYYSRVRIAAYRNLYEDKPEEMVRVARDSFKQLVNKLKKGVVRDPYAYFYRICDNKFHELYMEEAWEMIEDSYTPPPKGHWLWG